MQLNTFARKHHIGCLPVAQHSFPSSSQVTLLLTLSTGMTAAPGNDHCRILYTTSVLSTSVIVPLGPATSCPGWCQGCPLDGFWESPLAGCPCTRSFFLWACARNPCSWHSWYLQCDSSPYRFHLSETVALRKFESSLQDDPRSNRTFCRQLMDSSK